MSSSDEEYKTLKQVHHGATGKPLKNKAIEKGRASREQAEARRVITRGEEEEQGGIRESPFDRRALRQQSYSTDAQAVETKVARNPATQYLVLNSKDRNQTSSTGQYVRQDWNNFRLQRPQNIMQTYATRMLVSEINFPFYVPNINKYTKYFWIAGLSNDGVTTGLWRVRITDGFSDGPTIAIDINSSFVAGTGLELIAGTPGTLPFNPPEVSYANGVFSWTRSILGPAEFVIYYYNPLPYGWTNTVAFPYGVTPPPESNYYSNISLMLLMGMAYSQVNGLGYYFTISNLPDFGFQGNPTTLQYTQYVDIVSDKLHQYTTNRDGSTDNSFGRNLMCRLYISDEASNIVEGTDIGAGGTSTFTQFIPGVTSPFIIHRQFKNPKAVMWNKESAVDWLDISIYDEWGNLLPLPYADPRNLLPIANPVYPDFQITLLASEN